MVSDTKVQDLKNKLVSRLLYCVLLFFWNTVYSVLHNVIFCLLIEHCTFEKLENRFVKTKHWKIVMFNTERNWLKKLAKTKTRDNYK